MALFRKDLAAFASCRWRRRIAPRATDADVGFVYLPADARTAQRMILRGKWWCLNGDLCGIGNLKHPKPPMSAINAPVPFKDFRHPPTIEPIAVSGVLFQIFHDQIPQPNQSLVDRGLDKMATLCVELTYFSELSGVKSGAAEGAIANPYPIVFQ